MEKDHIISEVRKKREQLSERFNNDLDKLFEYFKKEQSKSKTKVKNFQARKKPFAFFASLRLIPSNHWGTEEQSEMFGGAGFTHTILNPLRSLRHCGLPLSHQLKKRWQGSTSAILPFLSN